MLFRRFLFLLAGAPVLFLSAAIAAAPAADDAALLAAEAQFQKAIAGDSNATNEAVRAFEALAAGDGPRGPLYLAYLGAAQSMQGRDAWMPWTKMKATERGLAGIDKALRQLEPRHDVEMVRDTPVALVVRLIAVKTFLIVPETFFHRNDRARALLKEAFAYPGFKTASGEVRAGFHQQAAIAAGRAGNIAEERAQLQKAVAAAGSGPIADAARLRLKEIGS
jgi:hypothetical protein